MNVMDLDRIDVDAPIFDPDAFGFGYEEIALNALARTPEFQVGPLYEFSAGNGPDPNTSPNFTRHVIMLRFVAKR